MQQNASKESGGFILFFLIGLVGALAVGWLLFPALLYSEKQQPIAFNHKAHVENAGMACEDCHSYRENGSFAGLPTTEQCAECHMDVTGGETPGEKEIDRFVTEYVQAGKQVDWLVYQHQPDNVYFSHIAHDGFACAECHPDVGNAEVPPSLYRNRITGYSKTTMKMWQCERCHAQLETSNGCQVCHK
ncbi:class III cytochrome C family protein [Desulfocurvibacter africanus PCS]|uniref:Class III cytochrome C family protein n=1 Tax=Desulfocurvibacter africanus PCS TaxID=1262666 RepID=M5PVG5_DESAF|nr:class III cytochrome C family protein [Desulfocurvibacter africanus PCS]